MDPASRVYRTRRGVDADIARQEAADREIHLAPVREAQRHIIGWRRAWYSYSDGGGYWYAHPVFDEEYQRKFDRGTARTNVGGAGCLLAPAAGAVLAIAYESGTFLLLGIAGLIWAVAWIISAADVPSVEDVIGACADDERRGMNG